jgi:TonB-linked SusC/RagA family outer membrane protein
MLTLVLSAAQAEGKSGHLTMLNDFAAGHEVNGPVALQQETITGTVTDANSGQTLPGVNILVKGTTTGTSTDANGAFELTLESLQDTLVVSFIGFQRQEVPINGRNAVDIAMQTQMITGEELVVTALGFTESKDESGIASSSIGSEEINRSGSNDLIGGLSSKAAGLSITKSSGDPGSGSQILIRGAVSLQGNNQPLFIIDGVPVSNSTLGSSGSGVTQQSRINDLNPDDIASVEVLKGPSAASLWGSRAANGAIVIQTKTGSLNNDLEISFNNQLTIDQINQSVNMQRQYGQGEDGQFLWGSRFSWGDKISERSGGEDVLARPDFAYSEITEKNSRQIYDQSERFFETGVGLNNSISLSGGDEKSAFYLSLENLNQKGIALTNSNYKRSSVRTNITHNFTDKFSTKVNVNYVRTNSDRIQKGSNTAGLALGAYRSPPDFDHYPYLIDFIDQNGNIIDNQQRSYRNPDGSSLSSGYDNPLWSINENRSNSNVNRIFGNTEFQYNFNSWLNLIHRLGVDYYTDRRFQILPPGNASVPSGSLEEDTYSEYQINSDLIARANYQLNENFSGSALLGWNLNQRDFDHLFADVTNFILDDAPRNLNNGLDRFPGEFRSIQRTSALYSEIQFDAYEQLFLKVTGRSESASTYGPDTENTYFYPSASLAWQFTELDALADNSFLTFGKLRTSYGQAGVQPSVYNTQTTFTPASFGEGWGPVIDALSYGNGTTRGTQQGNPNLKPEITSEIEVGLDLRFLNDRLSLSATQYFTSTKDAILGLDVAPSTGFATRIANGAEIENYGTEIELSGTWVQSGDFAWSSNINWSTNNSEVTSLLGVENINIGGLGTVTNRAITGEPFGVLFGGQFEQDANGDAVLNSNGFPVFAAEPGIIGNPNPDWKAGIGNTFSYKGASLNVLVDIKQGGDVWNGTRGRMVFFGTHGSQIWETTAQQDLRNYNGTVIPEGTTFRGYVQDFGNGPVAIDQAWFVDGPGSGFNGPTGQFVEDGGYVRLREVSLQYAINSQKFSDITGLRSVELGVVARNLALWTDYSGIDPETNLYGPSNLQGIDYFNNPGTRSFVFTLGINY